MAGMTPEASAAFWAKALDKDPATLTEVGSKVVLHPIGDRSVATTLRPEGAGLVSPGLPRAE